MKKEEFIRRRGQEAYDKMLKRNSVWQVNHPEAVLKIHRELNRKNGKYYAKAQEHNRTGLRGERHKIRVKHGKRWQQYKNIIAPESQIHHEWIPGTSEYTGLALVVEADQHIHGFIKVIEILKGKITLLTEEEVRKGGK